MKACLWPNREITIWQDRKPAIATDVSSLGKKPGSDVEQLELDSDDERAPSPEGDMGLLNVSNFDKAKKQTARYGLKGITSKGRRTVRNAAFMLVKSVRARYLTFATVTLPTLNDDQMTVIHENWHRVVDAYRREVRRELKRAGLDGNIVGVTEIQPKRFHETGEPVLHCHLVWEGRKHGKDWAIKPKKHDEIWKRALKIVLGVDCSCIKSAAQLKQADGNAEKYLGKYLSKSKDDIERVVQLGKQSWLPKQWWNCSRALKRQIDERKHLIADGAAWLTDLGLERNSYFWDYFTEISRTEEDGSVRTIAYVGKLSIEAADLVRSHF